MVRTVTIKQWLVKLQEAKALKEQVEIAQCKEAVLKAKLGTWQEETYVLTASIERKLASLQVTQQKIQADSTKLATEQLVEQVKQAVTHYTAEVAVIQVELGSLHDKISTPTE